MRALGVLGVTARPSRDRLDALAVALAEQPHRVHGERSPAPIVAQHLADLAEVLLQPFDPAAVEGLLHINVRSCSARASKFLAAKNHK